MEREQVLNASEFHANGGCTVTVGPRGGVKVHMEVWRRNGMSRTWKTRDDVVVPVKHGMYDYSYVRWPEDSALWHTRANCPVLNEVQSHV